MEQFNTICELYEPMITKVLRKAKVYKDHEHYRQCARIALWNAWKSYDPTRGDFAPYAYWTMLTSIYKEIEKDNQYKERNIAYDKDKLVNLSHYVQVKEETMNEFETLKDVLSCLAEADYKLMKALYIFGATYDEIAATNHMSASSLRKRRQRIVEKIRDMLESNE